MQSNNNFNLVSLHQTIFTEGAGLEIAAVNNRIFCSLLRIERF